MATSRRDFIKKSTLVALAAGLPLNLVTDVAGKEARPPVGTGLGLTKAAFDSELDTQFRFNDGNSKVLVKLINVSDLPHRKAARPGKEGFSLMFRGSQANALKQNTYLIEHERLGAFSFLIVPMPARDKGAICYEAIINCLYP
jgi:hypothetical protein